jgi:hypothetical protein
MKLCLFPTSLLCLVFSSLICVAESRYATLSVGGTNQTDQITLQDFEVARLASASDPQTVFSLMVAKSSFSTSSTTKTFKAAIFVLPYYIPPKPIVVTGLSLHLP